MPRKKRKHSETGIYHVMLRGWANQRSVPLISCEVTTYYDVSGSVEERVFEDTYTINLYSDRYKQIPYTLTSPKTVKMVTEHEYWNPSTYQLQVDKTTWNFVIPAGVSSYTFDTIENRFYYFNSELAYGYSIKTYELVDQ